jgi:hypothetical protein
MWIAQRARDSLKLCYVYSYFWFSGSPQELGKTFKYR